MNAWLDTETKALLQSTPPEKDAPPDTGAFTLVLLKKGSYESHLIHSLKKIQGISDQKAEFLATQSCPLPVATGLSSIDALLGQLDLVCCDSISVFLRDDIVFSATGDYLPHLYSQLLKSPEFDEVLVSAKNIPQTEQGQRLILQFLYGYNWITQDEQGNYSCRGLMLRKKANIFKHWAEKIGAEVTIVEDQP